MVDADVVNTRCAYCQDIGPQRVVREGGESSLLWCQSCFHVSVAGTAIAWPIDPLPFSASMSVLVKSLDEDHGRLIRLLNDLQAAVKVGDADRQRRLGEVLLVDLEQHFLREEEFLEECGYPELSQHRWLHVCLEGDLRRHLSRLAKAPAEQIVFEIKMCLLGHLVEDMEYKNFVQHHHNCDIG